MPGREDVGNRRAAGCFPVVLLTASQLTSFWLEEPSQSIRHFLAFKAARDVPLLAALGAIREHSGVPRLPLSVAFPIGPLSYPLVFSRSLASGGRTVPLDIFGNACMD